MIADHSMCISSRHSICPLASAVFQISLWNVRPQPPDNMCSLIPTEQLQPGQSAVEWASSSVGLLHLSRSLRPGVLLEYRKHKSDGWVPAVVLHSRMVRPRLSSWVKEVLQQQRKAAAVGVVAAAAAGVAAADSKGPVIAVAQGGVTAAAPTPAAADSRGAAAGGARPEISSTTAADVAAGEGSRAAGPMLQKQWDGKVNCTGLVEMGKWLRVEGTSASEAGAEQMYAAPAEDEVVLVMLILGSSLVGSVSIYLLGHDAINCIPEVCFTK